MADRKEFMIVVILEDQAGRAIAHIPVPEILRREAALAEQVAVSLDRVQYREHFMDRAPDDGRTPPSADQFGG
jgi:hypothetical protein